MLARCPPMLLLLLPLLLLPLLRPLPLLRRRPVRRARERRAASRRHRASRWRGPRSPRRDLLHVWLLHGVTVRPWRVRGGLRASRCAALGLTDLDRGRNGLPSSFRSYAHVSASVIVHLRQSKRIGIQATDLVHAHGRPGLLFCHICDKMLVQTALRQGGPALLAALPGGVSHGGRFLPAAADAAPLATHAAGRVASTSGSTSSGSSGGSNGGGPEWRRWLLGAGAVAAAGGAGAALAEARSHGAAAPRQPPATGQQQQQHAAAGSSGGARQLPKYTAEEVARHRTPESGIWVTYQG